MESDFKCLLGACIGSWSQFFLRQCVGGLLRFVESVFTAVQLVSRFWRFVDSVLTTQKPVRRMYTFVEFDFTAARLVGGLGRLEDFILGTENLLWGICMQRFGESVLAAVKLVRSL